MASSLMEGFDGEGILKAVNSAPNLSQQVQLEQHQRRPSKDNPFALPIAYFLTIFSEFIDNAMFAPPLLIFILSNIIFFLTAKYTDRGSRLRYVALVLLAANACFFQYATVTAYDPRGWAGRVTGGAAFWAIVTLFDRLILRGWDHTTYSEQTTAFNKAQKGRTVKSATNDELNAPVDFVSAAVGDTRGVGTFWEVKNIRKHSEVDPEFVPGRPAFLAKHVLTVIAMYHVHNWAVAEMLGLNQNLLDASHIPLLSRLEDVTYEEVQTRSMATFTYWLAQCALLQFFYSIASALAAIGSPQDIRLFRPLFGSPSDAYSIRNAWGKSWHQTLRSGVEGVSAFLAHDVLHLSQSGLLQRYSKIFFSFALSGIMHVFSDGGGGVPASQSGAMRFFCVQALGIILEDGMQAVWRRMPGSQSRAGDLVGRVIGYIWVAGFVIWSSPVWIYPVILGFREDDAMLSLTSIRSILFRK